VHRVSVAGFLSVLAATIAATAGQAALVINELLYDPEGADAGKEFVEIMNTGPYAVTLDGVVLEAGDGSPAGRLGIVIWTGSSERAIPPGGYVPDRCRRTRGRGEVRNSSCRTARMGFGW